MFPPSTTRDKEQEVDGETEYHRRRQGCKLQKDYTLEHVGDMTPEVVAFRYQGIGGSMEMA